MRNFEILTSHKAGLASPDSYVVTRSNTSFLRLLGRQPEWRLVTATAGEEVGSIRVCADQRRLMGAAMRTCLAQGVARPRIDVDHLGREFAVICTVRQDPGESDETVKDQLDVVIAQFFDFYDGHESPHAGGRDEIRGVYDALAAESGDDVYLGDGLWLGSDGSLRDAGR